MKKAVIFDIDGTLTPDISWVALTRDLGASVEIHDIIFKDFLAGKVAYEESKKQLIQLWKDTGNANRHFIEQLFHTWTIYEEAYDLIDYLKQKNYNICLITGSFDLYAQVIAKRLGITLYYANTQLIWDQAGNLIDFNYFHNQEAKKLEHFLEYCKKQTIQPADCIIVGDDDNDIELFRYTGKGISVKSNTSHKLEHLAWKQVNNLLEIKNIVQ